MRYVSIEPNISIDKSDSTLTSMTYQVCDFDVVDDGPLGVPLIAYIGTYDECVVIQEAFVKIGHKPLKCELKIVESTPSETPNPYATLFEEAQK